MPNIIRRVIRGTKRRIREGMRDRRTFELHESGCRLLAQYDCDDRRVSVARIAKGAGVSVGAFYSRYKSKDRFVYFVTGDRFRAAKEAAKYELGLDRWRRAPTEKVVREIVRHVVMTLSKPKTAGVIRAAFKLAPKIPHILEPLNEYRATMTECARGFLARRLSADQSPSHIDAVVQMVFATAIDSILEKPGPLKIGSQGMIDALSDMALRFLGFSGDRTWSSDAVEAEETDEPAPSPAGNPEEDEGANKVPEGHVAIVDPNLRTVTGSISMPTRRPRRRRQRQRQRQRPPDSAEPVPTSVNPTKLRPNTPTKDDSKSGAKRRKRRIRLV